MSLSSLRSFSGAASFATSAFDTARSTFKAMAEAAAPPAGSDAAGGAGADAAGGAGADAASGAGTDAAGRTAAGRVGSDAGGERHPAAPLSPPTGTGAGLGEVRRETERGPAEKRKAGVRKGLALDAYA